MRVRLKPLPVMTACAIAAFVVLIMLGSWQWGRFSEKKLLAETTIDSVALAPFTVIEGGPLLVYGVRDGQPGWRVFQPIRYGDVSILVDVAHVSGSMPPDWRTLSVPQSLTSARAVTGIPVTPRKSSAFAAKSDPAAHVWYQIDLPAMGESLKLDRVEPYYVAMPYVGATGQAEANPFAGAAALDPLPPERHLGYAVTWWGLAAALVGVYLAFHARAGRLVVTR
jgi:surfeit locus 1 family protein